MQKHEQRKHLSMLDLEAYSGNANSEYHSFVVPSGGTCACASVCKAGSNSGKASFAEERAMPLHAPHFVRRVPMTSPYDML